MIHLHVHSTHSLLEGTAGIAQLVGRAVEHGMSALALTDTGGLYGAIPFYQAARRAGIRPLIGTQLERTVLLARDYEGYTELCRIVTSHHLDEGFVLADAVQDAQHLFVLSGDRSFLQTLHRRGVPALAAITQYGDAESRYRAASLRQWAQHLGLRAVAVSPVYYLDAEHERIHRVLTAIRRNTTVGALSESDLAPAGSWFRSPRALERLYGEWPETLDNAAWVAEQCNVELSLGKPLFPDCPVPAGETPFSYLWQLAFQGVQERYRPLTPAITQRLQYELEIIHQLGFAPYFLIVWDIVRHARAEQIPIVGRGSAANSLVAYALRITRADPFKYDLYFERFLNLFRTDCPDIDLDICWRRRDAVIAYVYEKYGADRVAMIATLNTFKARSAVREVGKAFGIGGAELDHITRHLPHYQAQDIRAVVQHLPECRALRIDEEPLRSIVAVSEFIDGFPRHLSIHSGGVVIAPAPLTRFVPLQRAAKGILITQYTMHPVEDLGLVKMDLLGHRSLTVIDETLQQIWDQRGQRLAIEQLPDPDPLTGELLRKGRSIGCFQIESPAMRALLQHTQADNTDMLIKTLSLVRPGPSGSGMKKRFIARHSGAEATEHLHPRLAAVLGDTYGVMLYQEDILKVAHVIAGMNLGEADLLRRAMTKTRSPQDMARLMKGFLEKAAAHGIDAVCAEGIWELIANFAAYSYCKAHAATYGEIAYQCAYLKAHYPAEFLACVLSNRGGFYQPAVYIEEARRLGIDVLLPDVNRSAFGYTVEGDAIRTGFVEILGLTQETVRAILEERRQTPFRGLTDLCRRTGLPSADAETLIRVGACDGFERPRPMLLWELRLLQQGGHGRYERHGQYGRPGWERPSLYAEEDIGGPGNPRRAAEGPAPFQGLLAPGRELFSESGPAHRIPRIPDYTRKQRTDQELAGLGLSVTTHPLEYYLPLLDGRSLVLCADLAQYAGRSVTLLGWLIAKRRVAVADQGCMEFLTLEDPSGVFEAILFPRAYQRYGHLLDSHGPFLLTGDVQEEDQAFSLIAEHLEACDALAAPRSVGHAVEIK